jgi:hypothetical protein
VASGTVAQLLAAGKGMTQYTVEAEGEGVEEALSRLPGVDCQTVEQIEGRTRVCLTVAGNDELRPEIFRMANELHWVLWELHRGQASLEQLFRELTADADAAEGQSAPTGGRAEVEPTPPVPEEGAEPDA